MTNKEMDVKIRDAFEAATPNVLGSILADCAKQKRNITVFKPRRSTGWTLRFVTATAAAILVIALATGWLEQDPPFGPTDPLYTGTDPTGPTEPYPTDSVPTDPDGTISVDWSMNATWVLQDGTTQGSYPITINGTVEEGPKYSLLKLQISAQQSFAYQFKIPEPDGYVSYTRLVDAEGDFNTVGFVLDVALWESVWAAWAISTEHEYFIFVLPDSPSMFLVGATDPNVTAAEVMAYFDKFVQEYRYQQDPVDPTIPEPTDPDGTLSVDWSMNATWVMANGEKISDHNMTVKGTIREKYGITYLNLGVDVGQNFPYQFILPQPDGYVVGTRLVQADGDYNTAAHVQDVSTKETVWSAWAVSTTKEYFIFVLPDHPDKFLVGATDPNVTAKQILDYFDLFVDHYLLNLVDPPEPDILDSFPKDMNMDAYTLAMFQVLFGDRSHYAQALLTSYDDPRDVDIPGLFEFGFVDEPPVTDEERAEIVKQTGYEDYSWLDGYRLPIDKMDTVLQTVFGLTLDDMNMVGGHLNYLESTNCYYRLGGGSWYVGKICIVGTKTLDNGNVEVYYTQGYKSDPVEHSQRGVVTVKPVGDSYHILSNYYSEDGTWPGYQPSEPTEPDAIPDKLSTDPVFLRQMQALFGTVKQNNYFNPALCSEYDDARYAKLAALLYAGNDSYGPTIEEGEELMGYGWDPEYDTYAFTTDEINDVVMEVFGITVWDMDESAWQYFWYTKCSGRYFLSYNLTLYFEDFQAIGFRTMDNGDKEVYYTGDFPAKFGVVTVKPVGNSYQIVSNKWLA